MLFTALNMEMRCMSQNKTSSLCTPKKPTDSTRPIAESRGAQPANTAAFMRSSIACGQAGGNGICSNEGESGQARRSAQAPPREKSLAMRLHLGSQTHGPQTTWWTRSTHRRGSRIPILHIFGTITKKSFH